MARHHWWNAALIVGAGAGLNCGSATEVERPATSVVAVSEIPATAPLASPTEPFLLAQAPKNEGPAPEEELSDARKFAYTMYHFQRVQQIPSHRQVLRVTAQQSETANALQREAKALLTSLQTTPPDKVAEMMATDFLPAAEKYAKTIDGAFDAAQLARLHQYTLSSQKGAIALLMPGVPEALGLSEKQVSSIEGIYTENTRKVAQINPRTLLGLRELIRIGSDGYSRALALLTVEQRQKWDALRGN